MFEKFSMSSFQASFDPFWPKKNYFFAQNSPKHAYFQKLEENKILLKKKIMDFFAHFLPKILPKKQFFKNPKMSRSKLA